LSKLYDNYIIKDDLIEIEHNIINWNKLRGKSILITGAGGMIASYFIFMLIYLNQNRDMNISIFILFRDLKKIMELYPENMEFLIKIEQDVCNFDDFDGQLDFIFHAAGNSSPYHIKNVPIDIIDANVTGTRKIIEIAKKSKVNKILFTSTREIYGKTNNINMIKENNMGILDPLDGRSCYPESKRVAETILQSSYLQYKIPFNVARISHVYGPTMRLGKDGRILSDLLSNVVNNENIIIKGDGLGLRSFCYITDAVSALFLVLFEGKDNNAYNISNENDEFSIKDIAELLKKISYSKKEVLIENKPNNAKIYTNYLRVPLDTQKIYSLGWEPKITLNTGLRRTFTVLKSKTYA